MTTSFDRAQQAHDANTELPDAPDCEHDVYSLVDHAGIDAAASTVIVQCFDCDELGEATVTVDWS